MKKLTLIISLAIVAITLAFMLVSPGCKKTEDPIKYPYGTFPDTVVYNISGINSQYDDYNSTLYVIGSRLPIIFSSNRGSNGGQFDLVQGEIWYQFDQTNGNFQVGGDMEYDQFYGAVAARGNTSGNDFGPYSFFSSTDSYEYLMVSSQGTGGNLDLYYVKHLPRYSNTAPQMTGPYPCNILNTSGNDAYISFDSNADSVYFCSDRGGINYDIYLHTKPGNVPLDVWLSRSFEASVLVDSINSSYDEKCPFIHKNIMVFTSNRPGGMGGYDLYYSLFDNGKWGFPINLGPGVNSSSDEFRPVIGYHQDFTNKALLFSSNRSGGKGGFDLYFSGLTIPE